MSHSHSHSHSHRFPHPPAASGPVRSFHRPVSAPVHGPIPAPPSLAFVDRSSISTPFSLSPADPLQFTVRDQLNSRLCHRPLTAARPQSRGPARNKSSFQPAIQPRSALGPGSTDREGVLPLRHVPAPDFWSSSEHNKNDGFLHRLKEMSHASVNIQQANKVRSSRSSNSSRPNSHRTPRPPTSLAGRSSSPARVIAPRPPTVKGPLFASTAAFNFSNHRAELTLSQQLNSFSTDFRPLSDPDVDKFLRPVHAPILNLSEPNNRAKPIEKTGPFLSEIRREIPFSKVNSYSAPVDKGFAFSFSRSGYFIPGLTVLEGRTREEIRKFGISLVVNENMKDKNLIERNILEATEWTRDKKLAALEKQKKEQEEKLAVVLRRASIAQEEKMAARLESMLEHDIDYRRARADRELEIERDQLHSRAWMAIIALTLRTRVWTDQLTSIVERRRRIRATQILVRAWHAFKQKRRVRHFFHARKVIGKFLEQRMVDRMVQENPQEKEKAFGLIVTFLHSLHQHRKQRMIRAFHQVTARAIVIQRAWRQYCTYVKWRLYAQTMQFLQFVETWKPSPMQLQAWNEALDAAAQNNQQANESYLLPSRGLYHRPSIAASQASSNTSSRASLPDASPTTSQANIPTLSSISPAHAAANLTLPSSANTSGSGSFANTPQNRRSSRYRAAYLRFPVPALKATMSSERQRELSNWNIMCRFFADAFKRRLDDENKEWRKWRAALEVEKVRRELKSQASLLSPWIHRGPPFNIHVPESMPASPAHHAHPTFLSAPASVIHHPKQMAHPHAQGQSASSGSSLSPVSTQSSMPTFIRSFLLSHRELIELYADIYIHVHRELDRSWNRESMIESVEFMYETQSYNRRDHAFGVAHLLQETGVKPKSNASSRLNSPRGDPLKSPKRVSLLSHAKTQLKWRNVKIWRNVAIINNEAELDWRSLREQHQLAKLTHQARRASMRMPPQPGSPTNNGATQPSPSHSQSGGGGGSGNKKVGHHSTPSDTAFTFGMSSRPGSRQNSPPSGNRNDSQTL